MKKANKKIYIILLFIIVPIIGGVMFLNTIFPEPLTKKATEKDFLENFDNIMIVTNYLIDSKYYEMSIHHTTIDVSKMFANLDGDIIIDDSRVVNAIYILLKENGYKRITKEGSMISFYRSSTMNFGSGVAYSIDGTEPQSQFLTKLEPLSKPNWFYFEEASNSI